MTCLALDEMCVADDVAACLALKLMARYEYSCYIEDRQELFCFPYPFVSFKMFTDFYEFPVSHARQSCLPSLQCFSNPVFVYTWQRVTSERLSTVTGHTTLWCWLDGRCVAI